MLHVPSGWWHLVVNLEPAIAITQNFVPRGHLHRALNFLKNRPDQVSGFMDSLRDPYSLFMERLKESHPEWMAEISSPAAKKRKWEEVVTVSEPEDVLRGGFSFAFDSDTDEEKV